MQQMKCFSISCYCDRDQYVWVCSQLEGVCNFALNMYNRYCIYCLSVRLSFTVFPVCGSISLWPTAITAGFYHVLIIHSRIHSSAFEESSNCNIYSAYELAEELTFIVRSVAVDFAYLLNAQTLFL